MRYLSLALLILFACNEKAQNEVIGDAALEETYWKLISIADEVIEHPDKDRIIHLEFYAEDSRISGYAGCNTVIGNYVLNDGSKIVMLAASTKMYCEDQMDTEAKFLQLLMEADSYEIVGNKLSITTFNNTVGVFEKFDKP